MLAIVIVMIVVLVLAGFVLAYAAYPHRGENLPAVPWLGEVMGRAANAAPTVDRGDYSGGDGERPFIAEDRSGFFN